MAPIRTLSPRDAEIMGRSLQTGIVSNGCVQLEELHWRSDALRTWELAQRAMGRKPEVTFRIDELDLAVVYVDVSEPARQSFRATSRKPMYTRRLSLFEHRRMKAIIRKKKIADRLSRMEDAVLFRLRLEFHALLGRAHDPVARRRLSELHAEMAKAHASAVAAEAATKAGAPTEHPEKTPEAPAVEPPADEPSPKAKVRRPRATQQGATPNTPSTPPASEPPAPAVPDAPASPAVPPAVPYQEPQPDQPKGLPFTVLPQRKLPRQPR